MNIINNYFLLYHGKSVLENYSIKINENKQNVDDFHAINTLVLCINRHNFDKYISLHSLKELIYKISNDEFNNIEDLHNLQYTILKSYLNNNFKYSKIINDTLSYLFQENILLKNEYDKLKSLFIIKNKNIKNNIVKINTKNTFDKCNNEIKTIINNLENLVTNKDDLRELNIIKNNLNDKTFSIGITGIMNSGKSSMLNAIMKKEVLGSSVIAETANLSIIKYGKENAKIFYWNKDEWNKIEKSSNILNSIKEFVNETKDKFKNDIDLYIKEQRVSKEIDINNLSTYTSANNNSKMSNLIKYIELNYEIDFLKDGIEIVDTPGLDDPVIQREEITKQYLNKCDMLFHLMNVSQCATQKDIEFIINTLLYQNITKLLIIITKIDMVNEEQLEEVINYTKLSIKKQLSIQNKNNKLDYILNNIDFICISSKMALLHYQNKSDEANNLGYNLDKTGIKKLTDYINNTLYTNSSSKGVLMINSIKSSLKKLILKVSDKLNYELNLLNMNENDLDNLLKELDEKNIKDKDKITLMQESLKIYTEDAKIYTKKLDTFLSSKVDELKNVLIYRLNSNIQYSYEKNKQNIDINAIKIILDTTIQDGIIDIIREYKYKYNEKLDYLKNNCNEKYNNIGFKIINYNKNDIEHEIFINFSTQILFENIKIEVDKIKKSTVNDFKKNITFHINYEFMLLLDNLIQQTSKITNKLLENFSNELNKPLDNYIDKLNFQRDILIQNINQYKNNEKEKENDLKKINNKINTLDTIYESIVI